MRGAICGLALAAILTLAGPVVAAPVDYAQPANWLCRPGRDDVCSRPLTSTVVSPTDGALTRKTYAPDPAAPIDCFYVYPTVSREPTGNADMTLSPEIEHVAAEQFARFSAECRTYAPLYRQTTVAGLRRAASGQPDSGLAYADVRSAWRAYLAHDNHGRGVVLIGHSQGSSHLARLLAEEIDGRPAQRLLVSAIITGTNVQVPKDADVGGSFHHVPLCLRAEQTGCLIAYSSFLASSPPSGDAYFGRSRGRGLEDACVNPGALIDHGQLDSELPTVGRVAEALGTPLVENPGLISAECESTGIWSFLAVTIKPTGVGAMTLNRVLNDMAQRAPGWGLHGIDVNLTLGDLVEIVGRQAKAWTAQHRQGG